jgi:redox-sensitive bicupin YhaK (pirin superfamily)
MSLRPVKQILETKPTVEGAGVKLQRAFGFGKTADFDPFLLLDDFRSDNPADYLAGFPWHPHRGIETITYVLAGEVAHGDSLGNKGRMTAGDVQWMTAGSGILHQEMPKGDAAGAHARLSALGQPARRAEDDRPALPGHSGQRDSGGDRGRRRPRAHHLRRVLGQERAGRGRGDRSNVAARYVDISIPPGKRKRIQVETTRNAFAYVFAGAGSFRDASTPQAVLTESAVDPNATPVYDARNHSLVLFDRGDEIVVQAGPEGIRFLLVSGKPLEEPVAWYGPIVMNTEEELRQANERVAQRQLYPAQVRRHCRRQHESLGQTGR